MSLGDIDDIPTTLQILWNIFGILILVALVLIIGTLSIFLCIWCFCDGSIRWCHRMIHRGRGGCGGCNRWFNRQFRRMFKYCNSKWNQMFGSMFQSCNRWFNHQIRKIPLFKLKKINIKNKEYIIQ